MMCVYVFTKEFSLNGNKIVSPSIQQCVRVRTYTHTRTRTHVRTRSTGIIIMHVHARAETLIIINFFGRV